MQAKIVVVVEHLGGTSHVEVSADLEPNVAAWTEATFSTMAIATNRLLHAMLVERDRMRFEEEAQAINHLTPDRIVGEREGG